MLLSISSPVTYYKTYNQQHFQTQTLYTEVEPFPSRTFGISLSTAVILTTLAEVNTSTCPAFNLFSLITVIGCPIVILCGQAASLPDAITSLFSRILTQVLAVLSKRHVVPLDVSISKIITISPLLTKSSLCEH